MEKDKNLVKIKLLSTVDFRNADIIARLENKLLFSESYNGFFIFSNVSIEEDTEVYGRKKNKTQKVKYLYCKLHAYNTNEKFVGVLPENFVISLINRFDISYMRVAYLNLIESLSAMQYIEKELNKS
jgi:hypothetical protein